MSKNSSGNTVDLFKKVLVAIAAMGSTPATATTLPYTLTSELTSDVLTPSHIVPLEGAPPCLSIEGTPLMKDMRETATVTGSSPRSLDASLDVHISTPFWEKEKPAVRFYLSSHVSYYDMNPDVIRNLFTGKVHVTSLPEPRVDPGKKILADMCTVRNLSHEDPIFHSILDLSKVGGALPPAYERITYREPMTVEIGKMGKIPVKELRILVNAARLLNATIVVDGKPLKIKADPIERTSARTDL